MFIKFRTECVGVDVVIPDHASDEVIKELLLKEFKRTVERKFEFRQKILGTYAVLPEEVLKDSEEDKLNLWKCPHKEVNNEV